MEEQQPESLDASVTRKQARALDDPSLRTLFFEARSANRFVDRPVPHELLERVVELAQLGATSTNALPMRVTFVESASAKERLRPALSPGNVEKMLSAPVTAIVAADLRFYEHLSRLYPYVDLSARFAGPEKAADARESALMNATLEAAYLIVAARALGLDAGPMGGFSRAAVDAEFFADGKLVSLLLVTLGYGDDAKLRPRPPRFDVGEIANFL